MDNEMSDEQKFIEHMRGCQKEWREMERSPQLASASFDRLLSIIDSQAAQLKVASEDAALINAEHFLLTQKLERQSAQLKVAVEALERVKESFHLGEQWPSDAHVKVLNVCVQALATIQNGGGE